MAEVLVGLLGKPVPSGCVCLSTPCASLHHPSCCCLTTVQGIQMLLSTLIISLPAIINVGALLFLLFFVFSYMGR